MNLTPEPMEPTDPCRWHFGDPLDDEYGFVGAGADLEPSTLLTAYRAGIFIWPQEETLAWFSPPQRCVLSEPLRLSTSASRSSRRGAWSTTTNRAFDEVVVACARPQGTWINEGIKTAMSRLHRLGWAHSVEVWSSEGSQRKLVGGVYGLAIGQVFCAESMFHATTDASKVALAELASRWFAAGGALIDAQLTTDHLVSLGFEIWSRKRYLRQLSQGLSRSCRMSTRPTQYLARGAR